MDNRYLRDRAMRRRNSRGQFMRDRRNPYGSRGGYVDSRRGMDYGMDSRDYYPEYDSGDYRGYDRRYDSEDYHYPMERYGEHSRPKGYMARGMVGMYPMYDEMPFDGNDYGSEKEYYHKKLQEWVEKLKRKETRFGWSKDQVVNQAKTMGVKFDEFDEMEFYAIYLALVTDHPKAAAEPRAYLNMAKEWLMDDDVKRTGSEKVCAYLYSIVLGEEE